MSKNKHIIYAASEAVPFTKTGGLADVVGELPLELAKQDNHMLVVSPYYPHDLRPDAPKPEKVGTVAVPFDGGEEVVGIYLAEHQGVTYAFVQHPSFEQQRIGGYNDADVRRNVLLSCAVPFVSAKLAELAADKNIAPQFNLRPELEGFATPDIVHAHDWHTGALPVLMKEMPEALPEGFADAKSVFTIHNAGYTGAWDLDEVLRWANVPEEKREALKNSPINYQGKASGLTAGSGFADLVTTVSPTYATEITDGTHSADMAFNELYPVEGIINGIGDDWKPDYNTQNFTQAKQNQKQKLLQHDYIKDHSEAFNLEAERPVISMVSRMAKGQKGVDVVIEAMDDLVKQGWNVLLAGDGDAELRSKLNEKVAENPGRVAYYDGFADKGLPQIITRASDACLIPSRYEPCGITQLQAMQSGTIPIASKTGGLADTIDDGITGFLFDPPAPLTDDPEQDKASLMAAKDNLLTATQRAMEAYQSQKTWNDLVSNAMNEDFGWQAPAQEYNTKYDALIARDKLPEKIATARENYSQKAPAVTTKKPDITYTHEAKHLRCYNMYPRQYENLSAMKDALPRVASMGFNAVWVNPLTEVGEVYQPDWDQLKKPEKEGEPYTLPPSDETRNRSLYAMMDPHSFNEEFTVPGEDPKESIIAFANEAKKQGIQSVMCDVAFSHVAYDSPMVNDENTKHWFKRNGDGKAKRGGVDNHDNIVGDGLHEDGTPNPKMVWADVAKFDYELTDNERKEYNGDEQAIKARENKQQIAREESLEKFWKPYMKHLADLGFTGMRVDSVAQNDAFILKESLDYFKQCVRENNPGINDKDIVILGETLGQHIEKYSKGKEIFSHAYSSAFWMPGLHHAVDMTKDAVKKVTETFWKTQHETNENWLTQNMGRLEKEIINGHTNGEDKDLEWQKGGGAIGYPGSHDEQSIVNDFVNESYTLDPREFTKENNTKNLLDLANNRIHYAAMYPADEQTVETRSREDLLKLIDVEGAEQAMKEKMAQTMLVPNGGYFVFAGDEKLQADPRSIFADHQKGTELVNLTDYVKNLNEISAQFPPTEKGAWATRRNIKGRDDIVVIERHPRHGFDGPTDVVIVSCAPGANTEVALSAKDIKDIAGSVKVESRDEHGNLLGIGKHLMPHELVAAIQDKPTPDAKIKLHVGNGVKLSKQAQELLFPDNIVNKAQTLSRANDKTETHPLVAAR